MKRRALLALLAGAAAGRLARPRRLAAQTRVRLGYLSGGRREDNVENTVGVLRDSLREMQYPVIVPDDVAARARGAIERMVEIV